MLPGVVGVPVAEHKKVKVLTVGVVSTTQVEFKRPVAPVVFLMNM